MMDFKSMYRNEMKKFMTSYKKEINWTEEDEASLQKMIDEVKPSIQSIDFFSSIGAVFAAGFMACFGMLLFGFAVFLKSIIVGVVAVLLLITAYKTFSEQTRKRLDEWELIKQNNLFAEKGENNEGA